MSEEKSIGKFFVYLVLILALFLILIPVVFSFSGKIIRLELIGLAFLMFLSLIGFVGYTHCWGERVLFFVFLFSLANLVLIWYFTDKLFLLPLFLSVFGFLMGLPKRNESEEVESWEKPPEEPKVIVEPKKEAKVVPVKAASKKTTYSPGKYLASDSGTVYHEPKCEWAKRITKKRRVWFDNKKDANKKGYRGHSCIK